MAKKMSAAAAAARREYKRKWAAANKDKVKAAQDRYWEKKAKELKAAAAAENENE